MLRRVIWLFLPFGWALACGGRYAQSTDEGDDTPGGGSSPSAGAVTGAGGTSTSSGGITAKAGRGSTSKAGSTSRGGSSGLAGSTSAGGAIAVGGTVSAGGSFGTAGTFSIGGSGCACDAIGCAPPYRLVQNADGCCYHCELDFMACQQAQNEYRQFRTQIEDKYGSFGCNTAADCTLFWDKNECGAASCGVPMPIAAVMQLTQNLNSYAAASCSFACPRQPEPPCDPAPGSPVCIMNRCVEWGSVGPPGR